MDDQTVLIIAAVAAGILYFGPDLKKITGAVGDTTASVGKLSTALGNAATGIATYATPPTPSTNAIQASQMTDDVFYTATKALVNYSPGGIANQLFLRMIGK